MIDVIRKDDSIAVLSFLYIQVDAPLRHEHLEVRQVILSILKAEQRLWIHAPQPKKVLVRFELVTNQDRLENLRDRLVLIDFGVANALQAREMRFDNNLIAHEVVCRLDL